MTIASGASTSTRELSARKLAVRASAEGMAEERGKWVAKNRSYYQDDLRYMRFIVPKGSRVLDLGCGPGRLLAELEPSVGVGVDLSPRMIDVARRDYPHLDFVVGDIEDNATLEQIHGTYDFVILSDTIGVLEDIEVALKKLHRFFNADTRLVIAHYSSYWAPLLRLGTALGRRMPQPEQNLLSVTDFVHILNLADFEPIRMEWRQLIPFSLLGIGRLINRFLAPLPLIRNLCLRSYVVGRSRLVTRPKPQSATVLIPCRNERGNIERAILEMPRFADRQEILFVEGNSRDDTYAECVRVQQVYKDAWDIRVIQQDGKGKGDAVRKGFANATGEVLMILDADLTMPARELPKFFDAIASGKGEFVNGTRLVYPKEDEAMRFLNHIANRVFALLFSFLLNQRFTDTLCGTKVLLRSDYEKIALNRHYFGDFDPFGDFDLIFGAVKLNRKIVEVPIHYRARTYGEPQISRFRDGWLLLRMVAFAYRKLKAI